MRHVAFLRGINVGGNRIVKMERLRDLFEDLGMQDVGTFIASGNVLFSAPSADTPVLEARIERQLAKALGYEVATFVRTEHELAAIARHDPFELAPDAGKATLIIGFLRAAPSAAAREQLVRLRTPTDDFRVCGREWYWLLSSGLGASTVSGTALGKIIGATTTRNVTTVRKLAARLAGERKS